VLDDTLGVENAPPSGVELRSFFHHPHRSDTGIESASPLLKDGVSCCQGFAKN
jgi:hypothetical protein